MNVSAIIVNFNAGDELLRGVRTLLDCDSVSDIHVVDNASSDASVESLELALAGERRLVVHRNDSNVGFAAANNRALALVASPYVLLVNPDCEIDGAALRALVAELEADESVAVAGPLILNRDGSEQRGCRRNLPDYSASLAHFLSWPRASSHSYDLSRTPLPPGAVDVPAVSGACMLVRVSAIQQVGPLDDGFFLHCEDIDWCKRFGDAGWRLRFVPGAKARHTKGTAGRGREVLVERLKHQGMQRYYRKHLAPADAFPMRVVVVVSIWLHFLAVAVRLLLQRLGRR